MTTPSLPRLPSPERHAFSALGAWPGNLCLLGLVLGMLAGPVVAKDTDKAASKSKPGQANKQPAKKTKFEFVRLVRDKKTSEPIRMETATVGYVLKPKAGAKPAAGKTRPVTVDLIGVVHVGERSYYDRLNQQFEQYDALLYELVAQQGARPNRGAGAASNNPAGFLQNAMKSMLQLEHQLENIDYTKKNFVHADLSPKEMAEAMRKRGDNGLTITLGILGDMIRQQNLAQAQARKKGTPPVPEVDIFTLLADPNGPVKMKRMMAEQMVTMGATGGVGKTLDRILVQDRNQAAIRVFRQQITKGKRRLGIFYGAAHMPDFHRRLVALGFRPR